MDYWKDRVVLITGAASGVGRATGLRFAREGARLALLDRDEAGLRRTSEAAGGSAQALPLLVDLRDEAAVIQGVTQSAQWHGRLDVVVNCAGICPPEDFWESTPQFWDDLLRINLRGYFLVGREGASVMKAGGQGGAIVNVASVLGLVGEPSAVTYCATKGGIIALTRALAVKLAPDRIRVNSICPGAVATPQTLDWIEAMKDPQAVRARLDATYPLGHIAEPEDIAGAICFLSGPDARCITGANLVVDGGITAGFGESALWEELASERDPA